MDSPLSKPAAKYEDLRSFLSALETRGELKKIDVPVNPSLELTEICRRTLERQGPALLFTRPKWLTLIYSLEQMLTVFILLMQVFSLLLSVETKSGILVVIIS